MIFRINPLLILLTLAPLLSRPTSDGVGKYITLSVITLFFLFSILWVKKIGVTFFLLSDNKKFFQVAATVILVQCVSMLVNMDIAEFPYLVSSFVFFYIIYISCAWFTRYGINSIVSIMKAYEYAVVLLSILVVVSALANTSMFGGEVRPHRSFLLPFEISKTSGVDRSYGEQGIIAALAWAYVLSYNATLGKIRAILFGVSVLLIVMISQSRSCYLSLIVVTGLFMYIKYFGWRYTKFIIILLIFAPIFLDVLLPIMSSYADLGFLLGESTYEENVLTRGILNSFALQLLATNFEVFVFGVSHEDWKALVGGVVGEEVTLHNHFLGHLLSHGVIGGGLYIIGVVLYPIFRLQLHDMGKISVFIFTAYAGTIVNLGFYQGFFSLVLAVIFGAVWSLKGLRRDACE